jgi:hypothetical protein
MSTPSGQSRTRAAAFRRRIGYYYPDLRVSDAERADVADRLGKHYSDGRLDEAEFHERVDRAMRAKTQSDLSGLFDDLPPIGEPPQVPLERRPRLPASRLLFIALVVVVAATAGRALAWSYIPPWLLIGLLAAILLCVVRPRSGPAGHHDSREYEPDRPDRPDLP